MKKVISWNVNGIRACEKKGFVRWLIEESPDILAVQETKAHEHQLSDTLLDIKGYKAYWASAQKKGYSGTAIYTKQAPLEIETLGIAEFDIEGRTIIAHYTEFSVINCYFPNSQEKGARLSYKLDFCEAVLEKSRQLVKKGRNIVICGDYNIAHTEIDLKNPKQNEKNPGYLPEERAWMTRFLATGHIDTFRLFHPGQPGHYSWWSFRYNAREKDIGWRIDYHCVNEAFKESVITASIHKTVEGSDHCPVSVTLDIG